MINKFLYQFCSPIYSGHFTDVRFQQLYLFQGSTNLLDLVALLSSALRTALIQQIIASSTPSPVLALVS